jgi:hypothetical protein
MNLIESSTTIYSRLLYLYPSAVRRSDGEAMMQIFRDLAREELRGACGPSEAPGSPTRQPRWGGPQSRRASASGGGAARVLRMMAGLVRLWARTTIDLVKSLPAAYLDSGHDPAGGAARRMVSIYILCVVAFVVYGAIDFREYYTRPSWSVDLHSSAAVNEDAVLRDWNAAAPNYSRYVRYWQVGGIIITILLGVTAALVARWQSLGHGLGALGAGWIATAAVLHLLPLVYFPFDQYPVGFLWMFELPLALLCFAATYFVLRASSRSPESPRPTYSG